MNYAKLINCKTPEEVRKCVLEWSSNISESDHLVRIAILEIHAGIEEYLKYILYKILEKYLVIPQDKQLYQTAKNKLQKTIHKMSFSSVYNLLKPSFISFDYPDLQNIDEINKVRNAVVHGNIENVKYKNRNPFQDHDCLAQIFIEGWAVRKILNKYIEFMSFDNINSK